MYIIWILVKSVFWYLGLTYCSINLLGVVVRSFCVRGLSFDNKKNDYNIIIKFNNNKTQILLGFFYVLLFCLYFYFLLYKFHWGFALASIIMMTTRFSDLIWEIKKNTKITKEYGPISSSLSSFCSLSLELGVAVLVCYSVYKS